MTNNLDALRRRLHLVLPDQIQSAADSYAGFAAKAAPTESKDFANHHTACKAALIHLEHLIRLIRWAGGEPEPASSEIDPALAELVAEARRDLAADPDADDTDDNDGETA